MDTPSPLAAWQTFFFLVGSAGAGLTGLQFVVIALIAESSRRATTREIQAFGTPTILHFSAVLLVSAIMNAPWQGLSRASFALGLCGALGVVYGIIVIRRTWSQTTYQPVWEDWILAYRATTRRLHDAAGRLIHTHKLPTPNSFRYCRVSSVTALRRNSQRVGCRHLHHHRPPGIESG